MDRSNEGEKIGTDPELRGSPDVFLSYAREDHFIAEQLRDHLAAEGWKVWWDQDIAVGDAWKRVLEQALDRARAVIVLWTKHSVRSDWVRREARYALQAGKLVPAKLETCRIPAPFGSREMAMLLGWKGQRESPELAQLCRGLGQRVPPSRIDVVRPGFDPTFLGSRSRINWPSVPGPAQRLSYLHFTVVMNPARRLPWYVAYNVDGRSPSELPPRRDSWMADPLIAPELQPGEQFFKHSGYHRGHLVARKLVAWGDERETWIASHQAFFWTNMSPQHADVNTRSYLAIENWEQSLAAERGKLIGFAGPVLRDDDETFRDREEQPDGFVMFHAFRMPRAYWKVVASRRGKRLEHAAFLVENGPERRGSRIEPRVTVAEIEDATGLVFPPALREAPPIPTER